MNPLKQIQECVSFIQGVFKETGRTTGVIAVSGGIDSALSLTLLCQAIGPKSVHPLFLPYGEQSIEDSQTICAWNNIPTENIHIHNIKPTVDLVSKQLEISDPVRIGNIMARTRMIMVYDLAKQLDGLVCGTENKSEHYLGYFTRFGDSASDIEPICHLYKTQVRQLVKTLGIPEMFLTKSPSAGLWENQTDEMELGFSYEEADTVIAEYLGERTHESTVSDDVRKKVLERITSQHFKLEVPYIMS